MVQVALERAAGGGGLVGVRVGWWELVAWWESAVCYDV